MTITMLRGALALVLLNLAALAFAGQEDEFADITLDTATRLPQAKSNIPSSTTVITAAQIHELGIKTIPEIMRLVPGMRITQVSGWDYSINFHGTNGLVPRRMSVMINGISMFKSGFQQIDWSSLPIDINDIERIEVTRSPAGATYGTNSFQNVINIVTRHPKDVASLELRMEVGTRGESDAYLQYAHQGDTTSFLVNLSHQSADGFDQAAQNDAPFVDNHNANDISRINIRSSSSLDEKSTLEVFAGGSTSDTEVLVTDPNQTGFGYTGERNAYAQSIFNTSLNEKNDLRWSLSADYTKYIQEWPTCYPLAYFVPTLRDLYNVNPAAAMTIFAGKVPKPANAEELKLIQAVFAQVQPLGAKVYAPVCGDGNNNYIERRYVTELADTYQVTDDLRVNIGIGYQETNAFSETHLYGQKKFYYTDLFANAEYSINKIITANAGLMWEHASNVTESPLSERLGLNFHINDEHTFRLAYSSANRMPSILETDRKWSYKMRNMDQEVFGQREGWMFRTASAPGELVPERIQSHEIGLLGSSMDKKFTYDVRIFKEALRSLISEKPTFFDFSLTNSNSATLKGFEGEAKYKLTSTVEFSGGYSYLDQDSSNVYEATLYSRHAGYLSTIYRTKPVVYALTYYGNSPIAGDSYNRTDLSLSGKLGSSIGGGTIDWRLVASYYGFDKVAFTLRTDQTVYQRYDGKYAVSGSLGLSF